jgi:hypothetical protein
VEWSKHGVDDNHRNEENTGVKLIRNPTASINFLGYLFFAFGVGSAIDHFLHVSFFGYPPDLGIVLGDSAFMAIGLIATTVARALKNMDQRLRRLESAKEGDRQTK